VDATHNVNFPLYVIAGFLLAGGLVWLSVGPREKIAIQTIQQAFVTGGQKKIKKYRGAAIVTKSFATF
jgi:hypothetical protein